MSFTVTQITTDQVRPLRHVTLRVGQPYESTLWAGDNDTGTAHFGVFADSALVGIATVMLDTPKDAHLETPLRLRGMAVLPEYRRKGLGNLLLDACFAYAVVEEIKGIWCNARVSAKPFYDAYGFHTHGEAFELPIIGPHYVMWKMA